MNVYRPVGFKTLPDYIKQHPEQSPAVAAEVKKSSLSLLDHVKDSLGPTGTDSAGVMASIKELRASLDQLAATRNDTYGKNKNMADALLEKLKSTGAAQHEGREIRLEGERRENSPTIIAPTGLNLELRPSVPPDIAKGKFRVSHVELYYGAQKAEITGSDQHLSWMYVGEGLEKMSHFADSVSNRVQASLLHQDGALQAVSKTQKDVHAESFSAMVQLLDDLDFLRSGLSNLSSHQPYDVPIRAFRDVTETVTSERTGLMGKLKPETRRESLPLYGFRLRVRTCFVKKTRSSRACRSCLPISTAVSTRSIGTRSA